MATPQQTQRPDHWTATNYKAAADFVHKLTTKVLVDLDPQPTDRILDIGCGDGPLTAQIAETTPAGSVHGLDSSKNFIDHAVQTYQPKLPNVTFELQDCSDLTSWAAGHKSEYDKVFSNAALHWILRDPACRVPTMKAVFSMLKPGGTFVFEMGGAGNVAEMHAGAVSALLKAGLSAADAQAASPWFFPSDTLIRQLLEQAGFQVDKAELEYRPTRMEEGPAGGVEGWVRLMAASFFDRLPDEQQREAAIRHVVDAAKPACSRPEGGEWLGYVRCRAVARRPSQ